MFLPELLIGKGIASSTGIELYKEILIYSAAALPGVYCGARLIDSPLLGRKGTITIGCILMMLGFATFYFVRTETGSVASSCAVNFASQMAYAALFCYTPEAYLEARIRGTAVGYASSIGRLGSLLAIATVGILLEMTNGLFIVQIVSFASLFVCVFSAALLPVRKNQERSKKSKLESL